jgi:hypothetical protein
VNARRTRSVFGLIIATLLIFSGSFGTTAFGQEQDGGIEPAVEWLQAQQLDDGGFPGFEGDSDPGATADAIHALAAADAAGLDVSSELSSAMVFLESEAENYTATQGGAAKTLLAVSSSGADPRDFGGMDLIEVIESRADNETGSYDSQIFVHATAMIGIARAGEELIDGSVDFLVERQIDDGSWAFTGDTTPGEGDTNTTSIAIQALVESEADSGEVIEQAIAYLYEAQLDNGSVLYSIGDEDPTVGDSNSTALAIEGWIAAGIELSDERIQEAYDALLSFQNESGAFGYRADMPDDSTLSTAQSIPALAAVTEAPETEKSEAEIADSTPTIDVDPDETRVGLMIYFDEDEIEFHVVDLEGTDDPTALDLLSDVGYELEVEPFAGLGEAVCAIGDTGCSASDCFCESHTSPSVFWQFLLIEGDQLIAQHEGGAQHASSPGEIQVWAWTEDPSDVPTITFEELAEQAESSETDSTEPPASEPDEDTTTQTDLAPAAQAESDESESNDEGWSMAQYAQVAGLFLVLMGVIVFVGYRKIRSNGTR